MTIDMTKKSEFDFAEMYLRRDIHYIDTVKSMLATERISVDDLLSNPFSFIRRRELPQLLAYYEIMKKVIPLSGCVAEVGVFLGNGLLTWSKLFETFIPGNRGRKVYGFDDYSGYTRTLSDVDQAGIQHISKRYNKADGAFVASKDVLESLVELSNLDTLIPGVDRTVLYCGDLAQSFALFRENEPGVRIALLIVDVNLYLPTALALDSLFDLVEPGGFILLRGYGVKPWEGEALAVDEFISKRKNELAREDNYEFSMYPGLILRKVFK